MLECISVSIFGDKKIYRNGLYQNLIEKELYYPNFEFHVFYDNTIDLNYLISIEKYCHLHYGEESIPGYFWRFFLIDDKSKDLILFRDIDSRFSKRESSAVEAWKKSNKKIHIMRDHPHHNYKIMAGMWGIKGERTFSIKEKIFEFCRNNQGTINSKISDTIFLESIYDYNKNDLFVHDNWNRFNDSINFPTERIEKNFVGEIYDEYHSKMYSYDDEIFL